MEPSQTLRIKRVARFTLKETLIVKHKSVEVDAAFAKRHPSDVRKRVTYRAKKTTRSYKKGQQVPASYAKRFRRYVVRTVSYSTIPTATTYKQGTRTSEKFAKKHPDKVKTTEYMEIEERQPRYDPHTRKQTYGPWKVTNRKKMNFYEQILPMKDLSSRHIRTTFARNRIFSNIWENHKGMIRISINGHADGRRVKEVVHVGYLKSVWEGRHNGYSEFKDYLVNKVLQALRRKHLRLSNPKESQERIIDLMKKRKEAIRRIENATYLSLEAAQQSLDEINKLIKQQKQTSQIKGGTIRIEKLVE